MKTLQCTTESNKMLNTKHNIFSNFYYTLKEINPESKDIWSFWRYKRNKTQRA